MGIVARLDQPVEEIAGSLIIRAVAVGGQDLLLQDPEAAECHAYMPSADELGGLVTVSANLRMPVGPFEGIHEVWGVVDVWLPSELEQVDLAFPKLAAGEKGRVYRARITSIGKRTAITTLGSSCRGSWRRTSPA